MQSEIIAAPAREARVMVDGGAGEPQRLLDLELLAGGGVRDAADLRARAGAGAAGALVATALHRGAIG